MALSGAAAIHRVHIAAGIGLMTERPVVVVCADEGEGQKLARDLSVFAGAPVPVLGPRDFTFHNAAALSRQWEHRRLALLQGISAGEIPLSGGHRGGSAPADHPASSAGGLLPGAEAGGGL